MSSKTIHKRASVAPKRASISPKLSEPKMSYWQIFIALLFGIN